MTPQATKVYLFIKLRAKAVGRDRGVLRARISDLADDLNIRRPTLSSEVLPSLERLGLLKITRAPNQHGLSEFRLLEFDDPARNESVPSAESSNPVAHNENVPRTVPSSVTSNPATQQKTSQLRAPNTEKTENQDIPAKALSPQPKSEDVKFDRFWGLYPRKAAKKDAQKAWRQLTRKQAECYLHNLPLWIEHEYATKDQQYIPYPATWIRRGFGADPPPSAQPSDLNPWTEFDQMLLTLPPEKVQ